jgi:hypothetical protein
VVSLIRRLEAGALSARERDDLLGELSAAVLHLHRHRRGWTSSSVKRTDAVLAYSKRTLPGDALLLTIQESRAARVRRHELL